MCRGIAISTDFNAPPHCQTFLPLSDCCQPLGRPRTCLACVRQLAASCPSPSSRSPSADDLAECVARAVLCGLVVREGAEERRCSVFDSEAVPAIPLGTYLRRLQRDAQCSDAVLVCALVLLDRLLEEDGPKGDLELNAWSAHRLFLTCVVLASKYHEDSGLSNAHFARAGGIRSVELRQHEEVLLRKMGYRLGVDAEVYNFYLCNLATLAEGYVRVPRDPFRARARPDLQPPTPATAPRLGRALAAVGGKQCCFRMAACGLGAMLHAAAMPLPGHASGRALAALALCR